MGKSNIDSPRLGTILDSFVEAESLLRGKQKWGTSLKRLKAK